MIINTSLYQPTHKTIETEEIFQVAQAGIVCGLHKNMIDPSTFGYTDGTAEQDQQGLEGKEREKNKCVFKTTQTDLAITINVQKYN